MKKLFITLFLSLLSIAVYASEVTVNTTINKTNITIGDPLKVSVEISYPNELKLSSVTMPSEIGTWVCTNLSTSTKKTKDTLSSLAVFEVVRFSTGMAIIPPIPFTLVNSSTEAYTVYSSSKSVNIESTLAKIGDLGDIKDIKEPLSIGNGMLVYILVTIILLLIGAYIYYRRKTLAQTILASKPKLPPYEVALLALNDLAASDLLSRGLIKEYYIRLAEIMRNYISNSFGIETFEKTTHELYQDLKGRSVDKKITLKIKELFENCDLVKFAKFTPKENQCTYDIELAKTIVLERMPKENPIENTGSAEGNL
ncbi:MAG: hypothetical protein M0Q46_02575 [Endomicrobiales bacterium]|nr:hypothetical protein [Endomicrobiales bacterium]